MIPNYNNYKDSFKAIDKDQIPQKREFKYFCYKCQEQQTLIIPGPELYPLKEPRPRICKKCYNGLPSTKIKRQIQCGIIEIDAALEKLVAALQKFRTSLFEISMRLG